MQSIDHPEPLPRIAIDAPTLRVHFSVNTSPFSGQDGRFLTSRQIGDRLEREALGNVSVRLEQGDLADPQSPSWPPVGREGSNASLPNVIDSLRRPTPDPL